MSGNALSRTCGGCPILMARGFSPSAWADSRDVFLAVSEIGALSSRTMEGWKGYDQLIDGMDDE
jgi:hypothetical protein